MDACKISAQFAAYVWYTGKSEEAASARKQAVRFARANWEAFLPCADKGLGRLLLRIAGGKGPRDEGRRRGMAAVGVGAERAVQPTLAKTNRLAIRD